jgi:hypothetical protein
MKDVFLNWPQIAQRSAKIRKKNSNLLQTLEEKLCEQTKPFTFLQKESTLIPRVTKIIRSGIAFVSRNLR